MQRSFVLLNLCFTAVVSMVTVQQPPVLSVPLGRDAVLPCFLRLSADERQTEFPVLYWTFGLRNPVQVWFPSEEYRDRVALLDRPSDSLNKSLRLAAVRWSDGGPYLCRLTVSTRSRGSFRCAGNTTTMMVYDRLVLARVGLQDSRLRCAVNVSLRADFLLSIVHRGAPLQPEAPETDAPGGPRDAPGGPRDAPGGPDSFVTLSQTVLLQEQGRYECRLLLHRELVSESVFHLDLPEPEASRDAEPWHLYGAVLLVPVGSLLLLSCLRCRRP